MTVKAKIALKEIVRRNRTVFLGIGIFSLIFMLIAVSLGSCSASIQGGASVIGMTTYPSTNADIYAAENAYAAMEEALNRQINNMKSIYPDYCSLRPLAVANAFFNGRYAEQNGRSYLVDC